MNKIQAFILGEPKGISGVSVDITGRLLQWVENGNLCTVEYTGLIPKRLKATGSRIGTMVMDFTFNGDGTLLTLTGDYIPTLFIGNILTLSGKPLDLLGSGGSLGDAIPQPLGIAAAGAALLGSREDHVHAQQTPVQLGVISVPVAWNANTNTPTLTSSTAPTQYTAYVVTVAGATTLDGLTNWVVGDVAQWDPSAGAWAKIGVDGRPYTTWAARGSGDYHGQVKVITDAGNTGALEAAWDANRGRWKPRGGMQLYNSVDPFQIASVADPLYAPADVTIKGGLLGDTYGIAAEFLVENLAGGATGRTVTMKYGTTAFMSDAVSAQRRYGGRHGFRNKAVGSQVTFNKFDSAELDWVATLNSNTSSSAGATMAENSAVDLPLLRSIAWIGVTAAVNVHKDNLWWIEA